MTAASLRAVIKTLRKAKALSQRALAARVGVTPAYITMLERGKKTNPSLRTLRKLAKVFGVPVTHLSPAQGPGRGGVVVAETFSAEWRAQYFQKVALSPDEWIESARILKTAAKAMQRPWEEAFEKVRQPPYTDPNIEIGQVLYMLMGFAMEALVKAIVVGATTLTVAGGKIPRDLMEHDTLKLLKGVSHGLVLSDDDRCALRQLQGYAVWAGRYPSSTKLGTMDPSRTVTPGDVPIFDSLYQKLEARAEQLARLKV